MLSRLKMCQELRRRTTE